METGAEPAQGAGATMTLAMDVRLASTTARVGLVFGKIGIVPEACSTWFLPRIVGMSRALELVYTADVLLGPLTPQVFMHQRHARGMELEELKRDYADLVERLLG